MAVISNSFPNEGTINGQKTITFPMRAMYLEIINDNASGILEFKFNIGEEFTTLKPLEAITPRTTSKTLILKGSGDYRVRAEG
jgi:hypothetical protein